jgi:hypothetical protein
MIIKEQQKPGREEMTSSSWFFNLKQNNSLFQKLWRQGGHSPVLRADECADLNCCAVGFRYGLAVEYAAHE